jgi:uncharacterized protein YbjQ (UPF0145 family)
MSTSAPYPFGVERTVRIVVTTGNEIAGHPTTEILGIVRGIVVRSPSIGQGSSALSKHRGRMIVTTGNEVDGRAIVDYLGVVRGIVVRVRTRRQRIRGRTCPKRETVPSGSHGESWTLRPLAKAVRTRSSAS